MKISVDFYEIVEDEETEVGTLVFDGKEFYWKYAEKHLEQLLDRPIEVDNKVIEASKEPEKFMENLHKAYSGSYFWAEKAIIYK